MKGGRHFFNIIKRGCSYFSIDFAQALYKLAVTLDIFLAFSKHISNSKNHLHLLRLKYSVRKCFNPCKIVLYTSHNETRIQLIKASNTLFRSSSVLMILQVCQISHKISISFQSNLVSDIQYCYYC